MKTALLTLTLLLAGSAIAHSAPRKKTWSDLLQSPSATPLLCRPDAPYTACIEARFAAWRLELMRPGKGRYEYVDLWKLEKIERDDAVLLCELGLCLVNNVYDGPWLHACRVAYAKDVRDFQRRRSCTEARNMSYAVRSLDD